MAELELAERTPMDCTTSKAMALHQDPYSIACSVLVVNNGAMNSPLGTMVTISSLVVVEEQSMHVWWDLPRTNRT